MTNNSGYAVDSSLGPSCAAPGPHHIEITHTGTGLTCSPKAVSVKACANAACTSVYTGATTVTVTPGNTAVSLPAGGTGIGTVNVSQTVAGTTNLSATSSVTAANAVTCVNSAASSTSCAMVFADSGFLLSLPSHRSATTATLTVKAVRKTNNSLECTPGFVGTKTVNFSCSYVNPTSGTLPARIGGTALNTANNPLAACGGSSVPLTLTFDATGTATPTFAYADVGAVNVVASVFSPSMTGTVTTIVAPNAFAFTNTTTGLIKAGNTFATTITAVNAAGARTPNFGREVVAEKASLTMTKCAPTNVGSSSGTLTPTGGTFTNGVWNAAPKWSEVGVIDLVATLNSGSYLSSSLTVLGNTGTGGTACAGGLGTVGRFIPNHFKVAIDAPAAYRYSGQAMVTTVTAQNLDNATTVNYSDNYGLANPVTLSARDSAGVALATTLGTLTGNAIAKTAFVGGVATASPVYTFAVKQTAPTLVRLRATESTADLTASAIASEETREVRSGRMRMSSMFGSEKAALGIPLRAEYWTGNSWRVNQDDTGALLATNAFALTSSTVTGVTVAGITGSAGQWMVNLTSPTGGVGVVDIALNLGSTNSDLSCVKATRPATTGAARPWLRSENGACITNPAVPQWARDPAATATYGMYTGQKPRRLIHIREAFN